MSLNSLHTTLPESNDPFGFDSCDPGMLDGHFAETIINHSSSGSEPIDSISDSLQQEGTGGLEDSMWGAEPIGSFSVFDEFIEDPKSATGEADGVEGMQSSQQINDDGVPRGEAQRVAIWNSSSSAFAATGSSVATFDSQTDLYLAASPPVSAAENQRDQKKPVSDGLGINVPSDEFKTSRPQAAAPLLQADLTQALPTSRALLGENNEVEALETNKPAYFPRLGLAALTEHTGRVKLWKMQKSQHIQLCYEPAVQMLNRTLEGSVGQTMVSDLDEIMSEVEKSVHLTSPLIRPDAELLSFVSRLQYMSQWQGHRLFRSLEACLINHLEDIRLYGEYEGKRVSWYRQYGYGLVFGAEGFDLVALKAPGRGTGLGQLYASAPSPMAAMDMTALASHAPCLHSPAQTGPHIFNRSGNVGVGSSYGANPLSRRIQQQAPAARAAPVPSNGFSSAVMTSSYFSTGGSTTMQAQGPNHGQQAHCLPGMAKRRAPDGGLARPRPGVPHGMPDGAGTY
ncbi:hypothetical protein NKR23_g10662 [Pleurostoma richardsiae]|uniref:Uncharacterized protein n=1 Tax=Pleurostoma richardsiae TaxID=41990 RepID=A0AA38VHS5_9PEZI|nr:hypothetical protein NKR23_g10662 [Pleurostoma richardsiae]